MSEEYTEFIKLIEEQSKNIIMDIVNQKLKEIENQN